MTPRRTQGEVGRRRGAIARDESRQRLPTPQVTLLAHLLPQLGIDPLELRPRRPEPPRLENLGELLPAHLAYGQKAELLRRTVNTPWRLVAALACDGSVREPPLSDELERTLDAWVQVRPLCEIEGIGYERVDPWRRGCWRQGRVGGSLLLLNVHQDREGCTESGNPWGSRTAKHVLPQVAAGGIGTQSERIPRRPGRGGGIAGDG